MVSTLRLEVDARRRKVDESLDSLRAGLKQLHDKVDAEATEMRKSTADEHAVLHKKKDDLKSLIDELDDMHKEMSATQKAMDVKLEALHQQMDSKMNSIDKDLRKQD